MTNVSFTNEVPEDEFVSQAAQAAIQATAAAEAAAGYAAEAEAALAALLVELEDYVAKAGSTMTGLLLLSGVPVVDAGAASKEYVDDEITARIASVGGDFVEIAGDTMTGPLLLDADPTLDDHAANKHYVDEIFSLVDLAAISALQDDIDAAEADILALQGVDTAYDGRLDTLEATDVTTDGRLDDLEIYDIAGYYPGTMEDGDYFVHFVAPVAFRIPTNCSGSQSYAVVDAAASTAFTVKKNGSSIGTLTFASAANTCSYSVTQTDFAAGDRLLIEGPATADTDLADIAITIRATLL